MSAAALAVFLATYALFMAIHLAFPYVQSGAALVAQHKRHLARHGEVFSPDARLKVIMFGHSKILSGFVPATFDAQLAGAGIEGVQSYNFGLPAEFRFVGDLETLLARGVVPDVVLLVVPWPAQPEPGPRFFQPFADDQEVMDRLFPFRKLPRDLFIMAASARGSPSEFRRRYIESEAAVQKVKHDRGYYFIERQSHYPNHELPPDFSAVTDTPDAFDVREVPRGPVFDRLTELFDRHGIRCYLIPTYHREGQFAPSPPLNEAARAAIADRPAFAILGPDYLLYPNRYFSDPTHLNPAGAEVYTRALAALVADRLRQDPTPR